MKNIKYNFKSFSFAIESDNDLESDILSEIYPALIDYKNEEDTDISTQIKFKIIKPSKPERKFIIYKDQEKVFSCDDKDSALSQLERIVTGSILEQSRSFLQLHAAGVVNDNKAMLIIAGHGIGKTSIVTSFLLKGFRCLSDDIILIDSDYGNLHCFPRALKISADLFRFLPELNDKIDLKTINTTNGNQFRRINPERICKEPFSDSSKIGWLIFLKNNGSADCKLRQIGQTEAFTLFIQGTFNIKDHGHEGIETIASMLENSSCYVMDRGNLNEATKLLSNLMINKDKDV